MFKSSHYDTDVLVRHMFFLQLSEYKPCDRVEGCPGSPYTSFHCMRGYKFHITMDNTMVDGYVSEKLFNGALGGGVPVYFGAEDVGRYVNERAFVHCRVSRSVIEEMRASYPRGQKPRPFLFSNKTRPSDAELVEWADKLLRPELEPCVRRVIDLDGDDARYLSVLREPFITNGEIMRPEYWSKGIALALNFMSSLDN